MASESGHPILDSKPQHPFEWWPGSKFEAAIVSVILVAAFLLSIPDGFFGALFVGSVSFLVVVGLRYGWNRVYPRSQTPSQDTSPASTSVWRHPIVIGIFGSCLLFLLRNLQISNEAYEAKAQLKIAVEHNRDAYDQFNSTGTKVGRFIQGAAHGYVGDLAGAIQLDRDAASQNQQFAATDQDLRQKYDAALYKEQRADSVVTAVIWIYGFMGVGLAIRLFRTRKRKKKAQVSEANGAQAA